MWGDGNGMCGVDGKEGGGRGGGKGGRDGDGGRESGRGELG